MAAIGADEIVALEELKSANQIIASSYEHDLTLLQTEHDNLKKEFADQESHLFKAIKEKDKLSSQLKEQPATSTENVEAKGEEQEPNTSLDALKQVSRETDIPTPQTSPLKKRTIWKRLYPRPRSLNTSHSQDEDATQPISDPSHDAELALERAALGSLPVP